MLHNPSYFPGKIVVMTRLEPGLADRQRVSETTIQRGSRIRTYLPRSINPRKGIDRGW
jgi:hypothetical protein